VKLGRILLKYSQTLKASGKYDDANAVLQKILCFRIKTFDSIPKGLQVLENVTAIGERYQIKKSKK
jgi:hypothetical protein